MGATRDATNHKNPIMMIWFQFIACRAHKHVNLPPGQEFAICRPTRQHFKIPLDLATVKTHGATMRCHFTGIWYKDSYEFRAEQVVELLVPSRDRTPAAKAAGHRGSPSTSPQTPSADQSYNGEVTPSGTNLISDGPHPTAFFIQRPLGRISLAHELSLT